MINKQHQRSADDLLTGKFRLWITLLLFLVLIIPVKGMATGGETSTETSSRRWLIDLKPLLKFQRDSNEEIQITLYRRLRRQFLKEHENTFKREDLAGGNYTINLPNRTITEDRFYESYFLFIQIGESLNAGQVLLSSSLAPRAKCSPLHAHRPPESQGSGELDQVATLQDCSLTISWTAKALFSFLSRTLPTPNVLRFEGMAPKLSGDSFVLSEQKKYPEISFYLGPVIYRYNLDQEEWPFLSPLSKPPSVDSRTVKVFVHDWKKDKHENEHITGKPEYMVPVERVVISNMDKKRLAVEVLLTGRLMTEESQQGLSTGFPIKGFELAELNQSGDKVNYPAPRYGACNNNPARLEIFFFTDK